MNRITWLNKKTIDFELTNKLLAECCETKHFTNFGKNVSILENYIHKTLKIDEDKKVIAVCNGACAINALVGALCYYNNKKLKFAVQAFTFPCSCQGLLIDSIIMDIDENMGPSIKELEEAKDLYDGVLITNCFGTCVNIDTYVDFCNKNNKILIFDNAASPYTFYKASNISNYGIGSIISLHHTKPIGFGEGGAIIVDKKYYDAVSRIISFGYFGNDRYTYDIYASNYKMSEINAIYIYQWLLKIEEIIKKHTKLITYFNDNIKKHPNLDIQLLKTYGDENNEHLYSCIPVLFNHKIETNNFLNIEAKKYYYPLNKSTKCKDIFDRIICFPLNCDMNEIDVDNIIKSISDSVNNKKIIDLITSYDSYTRYLFEILSPNTSMLYQYNEDTVETHTSTHTRDTLKQYASKITDGIIMIVGLGQGDLLFDLYDICKTHNNKIYGVDLFENTKIINYSNKTIIEEKLLKNRLKVEEIIGKYKLGNIKFFNSQEAYDTLENETIDLIYIDNNSNNENEIYKSLKYYYSKLKYEGFIIGNNYNWDQTKMAVTNFCKEINVTPKQIENSIETPYKYIIQKEGVKFVVSITTYKRVNGKTFEFIKRCIDHVNKQKYKNWDIMIIGDKYEDDNEFEEITKLVKLNEGCKAHFYNNKDKVERDCILNRTNLWRIGGASSMNVGLNKLRDMGYKYYCHLDDDDYWHDEHLLNFSQVFKKYTNCAFSYSRSTYQSSVLPKENITTIYENNLMIRSEQAIHSSVCFRCDIIKLNYFSTFNESEITLPSDYIMWGQIKNFLEKSNNKYTCVFVPQLTCFYN